MSLLLDALKRAEQEKLGRGGAPESAGEARPAGGAPSAAPSAAVLELQPMGGPAAAARADAHAAQAAQTVFDAKAAQPAPRSRGMLWATLAAVVVLVLSAGAYVWYTLKGLAPRAAMVSRIHPAPILPPAAPANAPAPSTPSAGPAAPPDIAAAPAPEPAAITSSAQPGPAPASAAPAAPARPVDELLREAKPVEAEPLSLAPSKSQGPSVPPEVEAGYEALMAGDLDAARTRYEAAVRADPLNVDAQLGLATVEARGGNVPAAALCYRRALEVDPGNPTALAGLAALAGFSRPEAAEGELRSELAASPRSAALQATLGNLYASQERWGEAQAAYFEAHRLQPENADVTFDLAVSLDHLGQRKLAADFYRQALESRRGATAQFDPAAAERRLAELKR
ncbi:MAG TPA: tetratricopeptide repeat protein [Usitatibacter sp.]|nr:tetratricopeptide repeat protein [Usitatibacter sp.]